MDPFDRPSTWALALGVGLLAAGVAALTDLGRAAHPAAYYALLGVVSFGAVLGFVHGVPLALGLVTLGLSVARDWRTTFGKPSVPVQAAPVVVAEPKEDYDAEKDAWRVALDRFFRAGEAAGGFSAGKLSGVAGSDAWPRLVHFYASADGGNVLRDAGGNVGHTWGHGWTLDRVMLAIGTNRLPRPDMPLPVIAPYVVSAAQRRAPQKSAKQALIEQ